ncbi:MAG: glycine/sarcosine/betaine reductase complex component C subunit beta [Veillonellales bacterium]
MPVIRGVSYSLIHAPDILYHAGATQAAERLKNPDSDYLKNLKQHLRTYEDCLRYLPNQAYIGNIALDQLRAISRPWYNRQSDHHCRWGPFGEIMPEEEFYGMLKIADSFDLVVLEETFLDNVKTKLAAHKLIDEKNAARIAAGKPLADIEKLVAAHTAEGLYLGERLVGCVRQAHEIDNNLSAHVMLENLVVKASGILVLLHLLHNSGINPAEIDYIIECSEEACGDMNQRGGGNFAKALGEMAGLTSASGCDVRGFCAGPTHALLQAASLVKVGVFQNVAVVGGGSAAKLGMNGKDHVAKGMPALEDVLGTFALLISKNDGINPVIRLDVIGKHNIGSGASPQQVMKALVSEPLGRLKRKITDINYYSVEMQNPELTEPAGAGNVPEANYKMIGALAVMAGEIQRPELMRFVEKHGLPGFAPTQGHIPSGVPVLGYIRDKMLSGQVDSTMLIGKGSLFLGRMTNLFDGLSLIIERNSGIADEQASLETCSKRSGLKVGITLLGSEHGVQEVLQGAEAAQQQLADAEVIVIGPPDVQTKLTKIIVSTVEAGQSKMEELLESGQLSAAVTMHYNFPIGTSTVGLAITPGCGKKMFIANTTGTSSTDRVTGMVKNALLGIAAAKAYGIGSPTVGILNVDGSRQVERILRELKSNGYIIELAESLRADGGIIMRGNDLLAGTPDIMVTDSLTGNLLIKMFSAFTTGGNYECLGYGYGPGIGEDFDKIINIISRSSGAPVITGAICYAAAVARGKLLTMVKREFAAANTADLANLLAPQIRSAVPSKQASPLPKKVVSQQITGIDVLELEAAQNLLWQHTLYAETGMGCTGPVILVAAEDLESSLSLLKEHRYLLQ